MSPKWMSAVALTGALLTGCVSTVTQPQQYSGYLSSYHDLLEQTTPSGHQVLRWVTPDFDPAAYSIVVFKRLELSPALRPSERVSQQTLKDLQVMASQTVKKAIAPRHTLIRNAPLVPYGAQTLVLQAAIIDVGAVNQGMQWYEAIPVAAVVGATQALIGRREQNAELYIEAQLFEARSGLPVVKVVRRVFGETLNDASQPIVATDFTNAFDDIASDLQALLITP